MDKNKLEALKAELPELHIVEGSTFGELARKMRRIAEIQIELALDAIESRDGRQS